MSDPQAVRAALGFQQQLQAADAESILAMSRRWGAVEASLQATIEALADDIAALSETGEAVPSWKIYQMERYQSLLAQIAGEVNSFTNWAIVQMQDDAAKAQIMARQHAAQMMRVQGGGASGQLGVALDKLATGAAEKITGLAQGGQPLEKILSSAYPTAVNALTNKLVTGAALGWHPRRTAREMLRNGGLDQALNHLILVARDQQIRNYRESQRDAYQSSSVVYAYKRLAAKNDRTCMACIMLDGTIYPKGEVMQLHPQDRCTMVPLIVGRPVPEWQTGAEWFRKQSPAVQQRMLGPGKYKAWQDGIFELEQLVTVKPNRVWGDNAQVTTLKSLLQGGGGTGIQRVNASELLKSHQADTSSSQAKTIDLGENSALVGEIEKLLPGAKLPLKVKKGINGVLKAAKTGDDAYTYTDDDGRLAGAISWSTKEDNQFYTEITAAGFVDEATNRKGLIDVAQVAQAEGRGILVDVPKDLTARYLDWGFTITKPGQFADTMQIGGGDDIAAFIKSPEEFGATKKTQVVEEMNKRLNDPEATAVFRSGYALPGTGYEPTTLSKGDLSTLKKELPDSGPLDVPQGKHAAAGIILIDPKTGKLVLVNPAGGFGGAKTTIPKGTVEEGEDLQDAAIREVFEETGFKSKIIGLLGDYEKTTSANRFYIGTIEDGAPWAGDFEMEAVQLVPIEDARKFVDTGVDKKILKDFEELHKEAIEKGNGDLEAGLDAIAAEKKQAQGELEQSQQAALDKYIAGESLSKEELALALEGTKFYADEFVPDIEADLAAIDAAEKEAKQKARVETAKASALYNDFLNNGPDVLTAVPVADLRTAVAWAYENGQNPRDIADLEAIMSTRAEAALLKEPVPLPDELDGASKAKLVDYLVQETGAAKWKISQLTKPQVEALFGQSKADILDAAEQGAAKYYAAKQAKNAPQEPEPQKEYVVLPRELHGASKAKLVAHLVQEAGVTKWKISQLTKPEIDTLFGKTKEEIIEAGEQGAAKYYAAKNQKQPQAQTSADKAVEAIAFTQEMVTDLRAAAVWLGVPASSLVGVPISGLVGKTKLAARSALQTAINDKQLLDAYINWKKDDSYLDSLSADELDDLEGGLSNTTSNPGAAFPAAIEAAINKKAAARMAALDEPEPVKFPPPIGKKANQYVEQLVQTGRFSPEEILAQVQITYPKTVFTLANVESKFKKFKIEPPAGVLDPDDLEILKGEALHKIFLEGDSPPLSDYLATLDKEQIEALHSYASLQDGAGWAKLLDILDDELGLKVDSQKASGVTAVSEIVDKYQDIGLDLPDNFTPQDAVKAIADSLTSAEIRQLIANKDSLELDAAEVSWLVSALASQGEPAAQPSQSKGAQVHSLSMDNGGFLQYKDKLSLTQLHDYAEFAESQLAVNGQPDGYYIGYSSLLDEIKEMIASKTAVAPGQGDTANGKAIYEKAIAGELPPGMIDIVGEIGVKGIKDLAAYGDQEKLFGAQLKIIKEYAAALGTVELPAGLTLKKAKKAEMIEAIASKIEGIPKLTPQGAEAALKKLTKAKLSNFFPTEPGITAPKKQEPQPLQDYDNMSLADLQALADFVNSTPGQDPEQAALINAALATKKGSEPVPASEPVEPPQLKTGTLDVTGAKPDLINDLKAKASQTWSGKALEGATKALSNIQSGSKGLVYTAEDGSILGVMAMQNTGSTLKVSGAAFANADINARAIADGLQEADKLSLPLETWVPDAVQAQYTAWGFKNTSSKYHELKLADAGPELTKYASQTITPQTDKGPIPLPPQAATMAGVKKLTKAALVDHISLHGNIAKAKLNKLPKGDLVKLIGQQIGSKVDDLIAQKEQEAILTAAFKKWQSGGNDSIKTSKEGKVVLEYFQAKGTKGVPGADIDALRVRVEELSEEERLASPFTPRFDPRPAPILPDAPKLPKYDDFPADTNDLTVVRKLGGSTGAELVKDKDGRLYVRKKGANAGHLREEVYADSVYQAAGMSVPRHQIYETAGGPVKLAEFVPGVTLADYLKKASPSDRTRVLNELRQGFAVDALLGNWDVLGLNQDNVIIGDDGKVYRIDNGGSLRYRAMGGLKQGVDWNSYATDIWSMRESGRGGAAENNARLFGDLDIYDIADQARGVLSRRDEMLAAVPADVRDVLYQRFENMRDMVEVSDMFRRDKYAADYTDTFLRESTYIRQDGLIDALPKRMKQTRRGSVQVRDEDGKAFDNWRGRGSHMEAIGRYMQANGGNLNIIAEWMARQAGDSWNSEPQAFKYYHALKRGVLGDYYWRWGLDKAKQNYERQRKKWGAETYDKTLAMWHAFTYESLRNQDFEHNVPEGGFVELIRTENQGVIDLYNLKKSFTEPQQIKRGTAESASIYKGVTVFGNQLTLQRVPWHRIHGYYFQGRGLQNTAAFLGDGENEFVFDGEGLDAYFVGTLPRTGDIETAWDTLRKSS